jgi:hypothetical protein
MPAAFTAALCSEFGVNPAWLLLGQGATWVADVAPNQAGMSNDLLEMVNAMTRIGKLRLGALAGKAQAKTLHELNDALEALDRQRVRLADETREVFARLLDDWDRALNRGDFDAMRHLRAAAGQVARLCPDPELELRRMSIGAAHDLLLYRFEDALQARRKLFLAQLGSGEGMDERAFGAAMALVSTLDALALIEEGARYAEAALALAPPEAKGWAMYPAALGLYGWELAQLGELRRGVGNLMRAMALGSAPHVQANVRTALAWAHFVSGAFDLDDAGEFAHGSAHSLRQLLMISPWSLDRGQVQRLLKRFRDAASDGERSEDEHVAEIHLAALKGDKTAAVREMDKAEQAAAAAGRHQYALDFVLAVLRTQVHRLLGQKRQAREAFARAERARKDVREGVTIEFNWRRIHWRNAVELAVPDKPAGRKILKQAEVFADWARERGLQTHAAAK